MAKYSVSNRRSRVKNRTVRVGGLRLWPSFSKKKSLPVQGPKTEMEANQIEKKNLENKLKGLLEDMEESGYNEEIKERNEDSQTRKKYLL
jgi:hypothetical protein